MTAGAVSPKGLAQLMTAAAPAMRGRVTLGPDGGEAALQHRMGTGGDGRELDGIAAREDRRPGTLPELGDHEPGRVPVRPEHGDHPVAGRRRHRASWVAGLLVRASLILSYGIPSAVES
jgi:hypothetical protein